MGCSSTICIIWRTASILTLALGVSVVLAPASGALASESKRTSRTIVETKMLRSVDGTGRGGPTIQMTRYSDKSVKVTGSQRMEAGAAGTSYSINLEDGTFKMAAARDEDSMRSTTGVAEEAAAPSAIARRGVLMEIRDPVNIVVAKNFNELTWGYDFAKVWHDRLVEWCAASAPTTIAGTSWFVVDCNIDRRGALVWGSNRITNENSAMYNNWDFPDWRKETKCTAKTTITGRENGSSDVNWTHECWGEWSWLISAKVTVT